MADTKQATPEQCPKCGGPKDVRWCINQDGLSVQHSLYRAECVPCDSDWHSIEQSAEYWKSRATTAELKVLTFHEEIAKLREEEAPAQCSNCDFVGTVKTVMAHQCFAPRAERQKRIRVPAMIPWPQHVGHYYPQERVPKVANADKLGSVIFTLGAPITPDSGWDCGTDAVWPVYEINGQVLDCSDGVMPFVCRHQIIAGDWADDPPTF